MKSKQAGFTLIEIAIVLVIIGLLLGGVLKGQELINSAKVKNLATDFKNVPVYIYGYQDKFRALPGDDANVANHVASGVPATTGTVGNGVIEGAWNSTNSGDETYLFWQHVRLAGLAPGSTITTSAGSSAYIPTNALGGRLGITNSGTNVPITGMKGSYIICSDAIPGKFAKQLDITMDDGNTSSGSMQAMASAAASSVTAGTAKQMIDIVDDDTYTVCMGF
jgi:prepilin-type N-terminal cleavage/methylation domain-containing protein